MKKLIVLTICTLFMFVNPDTAKAQQEQSNKQIVAEALDALFNQRDTTAIRKYFAKDYVQHNPIFPSGRGVLYGLVADMAPGFKFEPGLIMGDGEFVMVHSRYSGFTPKPLIIVDIYRVKDGIILEHWDIAQEEVPVEETVSKEPMFPIK